MGLAISVQALWDDPNQEPPPRSRWARAYNAELHLREAQAPGDDPNRIGDLMDGNMLAPCDNPNREPPPQSRLARAYHVKLRLRSLVELFKVE